MRRLLPWAVAVAAVVSLSACGEEPTPPRLTGFVPASPSVAAGETVDVRVTYEANEFELDAFQWTAEAGEIERNGKPAITYQAPETAGEYRLTVTTTAVQDGLPDLSLSTTVEVLPAPAPAVSEAPIAGTPAVEPSAGQRAAEAARAALEGTGSEAAAAGEEATEEAEAGVEGRARASRKPRAGPRRDVPRSRALASSQPPSLRPSAMRPTASMRSSPAAVSSSRFKTTSHPSRSRTTAAG